jgi:hypothetical protein
MTRRPPRTSVAAAPVAAAPPALATPATDLLPEFLVDLARLVCAKVGFLSEDKWAFVESIASRHETKFAGTAVDAVEARKLWGIIRGEHSKDEEKLKLINATKDSLSSLRSSYQKSIKRYNVKVEKYGNV